jgi:hypothetical protein
MGSREPSVASLAAALSRGAPAPPEARIAIARPTAVARVLIAAVLVLALVFLAALLALGVRVWSLGAELRQERAAQEYRERQAVPAEAVLRDAEATRREVLARPLAAGPIWLARCALLAQAGDWPGVDATCVQVGLTDPDDLLPATRLLHAEALHRLGRHVEAARVLHAIDQPRLDPAGRERAADLAGRLWLVERPAKQVRQTAPAGADQLDAR